MTRFALSGMLLLCLTGLTSCSSQLGVGDADPAPPVEKVPEKTAEASTYNVLFTTTKGLFVVEVHPDWAPIGAKRFKELVESKFYDGCALFRIVDGFMAQFGISGDPQLNLKWKDVRIADDWVKQSNTRGMISFATSGPNSRTTQIFINYVDRNARLDGMGFAPFAKVTEGMDVVDSFYKGYGEVPRRFQGQLTTQGDAFLKQDYPKMDYILTARVASQEEIEQAKAKAEAAKQAESKAAEAEEVPAKPTEEAEKKEGE